ncbi:DEAD-box type RNA helicase [Aphanomyces cochlioides]|nr:DEAD-box type RNA helicase [Aphanomyces cochlioides]
MNVALTRAKFACYVIGSEAALQNSKPWAALLDHARMTGCMVNVQNPQENLFALAPIPPGPPRGYIVHRSPRNRSPRGRSPPYRRGGGGGRGRGGRHPNNRHRMPQV